MEVGDGLIFMFYKEDFFFLRIRFSGIIWILEREFEVCFFWYYGLFVEILRRDGKGYVLSFVGDIEFWIWLVVVGLEGMGNMMR